jgi:hypothetical protein
MKNSISNNNEKLNVKPIKTEIMNTEINKENLVNNSNQPQQEQTKIINKLKLNTMKTKTTNEELVNSSNQTHNENKSSMSDMSSIMMYWNDRKLLKRDGVKETIKMIVEFHKKNGTGDSMIKMGERLLLEYDKPDWSDEVELEFLKNDLKKLREGEDFWKYSMNTEGIRVFKMRYKGVTPYETIEEYDEDVLSLIDRINKLETIKN